MQKKWIAAGCLMWIIGLAASIIGLNLTGDAGTWLAVAGNIVFLIGLGITGFFWLKGKKETR